jgi:branched-chain amino acid transport system ATP-binding protein
MGKTTTIRSIMGLTPARAGAIKFAGRDVRKLPSFRIAQLGIGLVPEGRQIFPNLTVRENLVAASHNRLAAADPWTIGKIHALFPRLAERAGNMGGTLSGGEQQMLAIGRALMSRPNFILMDEPSLGLAPLVVESVHQAIDRIRREMGIGGILVEQNVAVALAVAARAYVLMRGSVVLEGDPKTLAASPELKDAYLGMASGPPRPAPDIGH